MMKVRVVLLQFCCLHHNALLRLSIHLVPYDAVNGNKVSIRQLLLFIFTHNMFRPLRAILR
jgi:hypothetical protein